MPLIGFPPKSAAGRFTDSRNRGDPSVLSSSHLMADRSSVISTATSAPFELGPVDGNVRAHGVQHSAHACWPVPRRSARA